MAIAFVQAETGSTGGSTSPLEIPFDGFTADGNLLIIAVCATGVTAPTFSVTDTSSNTYLSAKRVVFGTLALELFYCIGCTGSGDITTIKVNIAYSGDTLTTINACIAEYNPPIGGLIFLDQTNSNSGNTQPNSISCMGPTFSNPPEIEIATAAATGVDPQLVTANPDTWTERVTTTPIPNIELQDWDGISSTQTADWSSGNTISTWCALTVAFYSITPSTQISRQPSQQLYAEQPSLWQEWEGYKSPSILPFFIPGMPRFIQASQRIEPLVDFNFIHWEQSRRWSTPTQFIPDSPLPHQGGQQLYFDLPNLWQEWEAYSPAPWAWRFTPPTPPLSHLIQRYIPLDDFDYTEWEQYRRWPVLVEVVPSVDSPTTRQASQVIINLPDFNSYWWDVAASALIRNNPLPSSFRISEEGVSGIYNLIANVSQIGKFRIQNARTGYVLYIGVNQIPIPSEGGTFVNTFSTTLPMSLAITGSLLPPIGEVWTYYIMVRAQDNYGLQSQNQQLIVMQLDSNGNLVLPPLLAPQGLQLFPQPLLTVLVRAFYPTFVTDPYPATAWQIWAGTTPPDTLTSLPIATVPVTGTALFTTLPSFPMPGKFYFAVGLYRVADGAVSTPITGSITLVAPPNELTAIPSGYEVLP